jgi:hypothetical protein
MLCQADQALGIVGLRTAWEAAARAGGFAQWEAGQTNQGWLQLLQISELLRRHPEALWLLLTDDDHWVAPSSSSLIWHAPALPPAPAYGWSTRSTSRATSTPTRPTRAAARRCAGRDRT